MLTLIKLGWMLISQWGVVGVAAVAVTASAVAYVGVHVATEGDLRTLPGIDAITGPQPPVYETAIFDLRAPMSIAVSDGGELVYVAEGDGDRAVKVIEARSRAVVASLLPPGTTAGTRKPMSVALAPNGVVYVVDRLRSVVDMFGRDHRWLGTLPDPDASLGRWEPLGVGVNRDGTVYVTNASADGPRVVEYHHSGLLLKAYEAGEQASERFSFPAGMAMGGGAQTRLFVSDSNNGRVAVLDEEGHLAYTFGNSLGPEALALPRGIFIDGRGYCYVADATAHNIKVWDTSTDVATYLFTFGEGGYADGELLYPNSVTVDGNGKIYVADTGNDRVQVWTY